MDDTDTYLGYDDICHGFCHCVKILGFAKPQNLHVVLEVVLDAVVDVWNLADVVDVGAQPEIFDEFAPATLHQLPRLAVVQRYLCHVQSVVTIFPLMESQLECPL